jgi:hypothetical protein
LIARTPNYARFCLIGRQGLIGRVEACPSEDSAGSECQGGGQSSSVADTARRHNAYRMNGVDDRGQQDEEGAIRTVAAGFGSLRDHDVGTERQRESRRRSSPLPTYGRRGPCGKPPVVPQSPRPQAKNVRRGRIEDARVAAPFAPLSFLSLRDAYARTLESACLMSAF